MIIRIEDRAKELTKIHSDGKYFDTLSTGLTSVDEIYKVVKGYPLFVAGHPHHGKSEFTLELAISLSINHGFVWAVYLGEAGKIEISMCEIASKLIGKPYFNLTQSEIAYAHNFISEKFIFIEQDFLTVSGFYDEVEKAEKQLDKKIHGTILDPFNDVKNETSKHGRTDIWLEDDLKLIRSISKRFNRVDIVVTHVQEIKPIQDKETGNWYVRPAMASEWAGGQVWQRRGMTMLLVYRVPDWMRDEHGVPYGDGKAFIINQKAKPKGSGRIGKAVINWDWQKNRYFEEKNGTRKYMLDKTSAQIQPKRSNNVDFDSVIDNEPF